MSRLSLDSRDELGYDRAMNTVRLTSGKIVDLDTWPIQPSNDFAIQPSTAGVVIAHFQDDAQGVYCLGRINVETKDLGSLTVALLECCRVLGIDLEAIRVSTQSSDPRHH